MLVLVLTSAWVVYYNQSGPELKLKFVVKQLLESATALEIATGSRTAAWI